MCRIQKIFLEKKFQNRDSKYHLLKGDRENWEKNVQLFQKSHFQKCV